MLGPAAIVVYFGLLALGAALVLRRPAFAAGVLLVTYGLEQWAQTQHAFFADHNTLTNYLTGFIILGALIVKMLKGERVISPVTPILLCVLGLVVLSAISTTWALEPGGSRSSFKSYIISFTPFALMMGVAVSGFKDLKASFGLLLVYGALLLGLILTTTQWEGRQLVFKGLVARAAFGYSDTGNPLAIASLAASVAMAAILMNFGRLGWLMSILRWGVVLLSLVVLLKTGSRGQFFAIIIATLTFLPLSRRITNWKGFAAACVGGLMFLGVVAFLFDRFASGSDRWDAAEMSETWQNSRFETSKILLERWADSGPLQWVFGLGHNASAAIPELGTYPHLVMAESLGELGVVGFVLLWLVVIFSARSIWRLWPVVRDDPVRRGLLATLGASFFLVVILSFKQGSLMGTPLAFAFAIMLGRIEWHTLRQPAAEQPELLPGEAYAAAYAAQAGEPDAPLLYEPQPPRRPAGI